MFDWLSPGQKGFIVRFGHDLTFAWAKTSPNAGKVVLPRLVETRSPESSIGRMHIEPHEEYHEMAGSGEDSQA